MALQIGAFLEIVQIVFKTRHVEDGKNIFPPKFNIGFNIRLAGED